MLFFRLFCGCVLQLLPFSLICLFPFKNHFKFSNKKTVFLSTMLILCIGSIFSISTIYTSNLVKNDYAFMIANGIFLLCLIPCFIWYVCIVIDIWQKKLFVFSFTVMSGAAMILINNTITTGLLDDSSMDNLPYCGVQLPILFVSTLIALPLILLVLKKGFMPVSEILTKKDYVPLCIISAVLLVILFAVFIPTDFNLIINFVQVFPYIAIVVAIFIIYYAIFIVFKTTKNQLIIERELSQSEFQNQIQLEQYNRMNDKISQARRIRHDSKHHFVTIKQFLLNNDIDGASNYIDNQIEKIDNFTIEKYCNNNVVNALLSYYKNLLNSNDIKFNVNVECLNDILIESSDLTVAIGNLLDNAYCASKKVEDGDKLVVFNMIQKGKMLVITVDNSFDGIINFSQGVYNSTKTNHTAYGLESIKQIAEKYEGGTNFSHESTVFHSSVMLRNGN